jgi:hypothetical protein
MAWQIRMPQDRKGQDPRDLKNYRYECETTYIESIFQKEESTKSLNVTRWRINAKDMLE